MRCLAVPCIHPWCAVLCRAVLLCDFFRTNSSTRYHAKSIRYQVPVCTCIDYTSFCFLHLIVFSPSFLDHVFFRKLHTYCRSERGIANKRTAQHRPISSAQVALGIIKSIVSRNHGPLTSAPFTVGCVIPCASVAGDVSRPRSGALILIYFCIFPNGPDWHIPGLSRHPTWAPPPSITGGAVQLFFDVFLHLFLVVLHEVSSYQVPAELSLAHRLSSAQQR